jgi:hypothetical protein
MCKQIRTDRPGPPGVSAEHQRVWPLLGAYVLGALERDECEDVHPHLIGCVSCQDEARQLAEAATLMLDGSQGPGPSDELWDRIAASVRHQAERQDRG